MIIKRGATCELHLGGHQLGRERKEKEDKQAANNRVKEERVSAKRRGIVTKRVMKLTPNSRLHQNNAFSVY